MSEAREQTTGKKSSNKKITKRKPVGTKVRIDAPEAIKETPKSSGPVMTEDGRIEYVNTSRSVILHVDYTDEYNEKPQPVVVRPGESVFFTEGDVLRNKRQSDTLFTSGLLRRVTIGEPVLDAIKVRDDMSMPEITAFVERADSIDVFEKDVAKLSSLNTLAEIETLCKQNNKTWDFLECVSDRKKEVEESRKI